MIVWLLYESTEAEGKMSAAVESNVWQDRKALFDMICKSFDIRSDLRSLMSWWEEQSQAEMDKG